MFVGIDVFEHPIFELGLRSNIAEPLQTIDGSKIRLNVKNLAPSSVEVDCVQVCLVGPGQRDVWFASDSEILVEGDNEVVLTSLVSILLHWSSGRP